MPGELALRLAPYDITAMQTGWFRAECLYTDPAGRMCGWHTDHTQYEAAHQSLSVHLRRTHRSQINLPKKFAGKQAQDARGGRHEQPLAEPSQET